jgi:hypothetical protein
MACHPPAMLRERLIRLVLAKIQGQCEGAQGFDRVHLAFVASTAASIPRLSVK